MRTATAQPFLGTPARPEALIHHFKLSCSCATRGGCICNRPTLELMRARGFVVAADDDVWRGMPRIVDPLAVDWATLH